MAPQERCPQHYFIKLPHPKRRQTGLGLRRVVPVCIGEPLKMVQGHGKGISVLNKCGLHFLWSLSGGQKPGPGPPSHTPEEVSRDGKVSGWITRGWEGVMRCEGCPRGFVERIGFVKGHQGTSKGVRVLDGHQGASMAVRVVKGHGKGSGGHAQTFQYSSTRRRALDDVAVQEKDLGECSSSSTLYRSAISPSFSVTPAQYGAVGETANGVCARSRARGFHGALDS